LCRERYFIKMRGTVNAIPRVSWQMTLILIQCTPLWKLEGALWVRGCKANGAVHIVNYTIFYNDSLVISYVLIDEILTPIKFCGITIKIEHKSYDKK